MSRFSQKYGKLGRYHLMSDGHIEERRTRVAEEYFRKGTPVKDIAEMERISIGAIYADITAIREEYYESRLARADDWFRQQLVKLDFIEEQALEAWFRSIGKTIKTMKKKDGLGNVSEQIDTEEELVGDPRFLVQLQGVIDRRAKLLGLDAPQTLLVDTMENRVVTLINEGRITFDMLANDVGQATAGRYFNLAGKKVPTLIEAEYEERSDED